MEYGTDYFTIIEETSIFSQRTPNSKFVEFSLDGVKLNTYEELPKRIQEIIDINNEFVTNPESHLQYEIINNEIKINKFLTPCKYIKVPEYINGLPVTIIGKESLQYISDIVEQIQLPNTIKEFEQFAFANGEKLTYINIPDQVDTLPPYCFFDSNISEINLNKITSIKSRAFQNCTKLKSIDLKNITTLGERIFNNCISLKKINFPVNITKIPTGLFANCAKLENIDLPDTIEFIGKFAFDSCEALKTIKFPKNLIAIEEHAFFCCSRLKKIATPPNLLNIGAGAFQYTQLEEIRLNKNLEHIGSTAFGSVYGHTIKKVIIDKNTSYCGDSFGNVEKYERMGLNQSSLER